MKRIAVFGAIMILLLPITVFAQIYMKPRVSIHESNILKSLYSEFQLGITTPDLAKGKIKKYKPYFTLTESAGRHGQQSLYLKHDNGKERLELYFIDDWPSTKKRLYEVKYLYSNFNENNDTKYEVEISKYKGLNSVFEKTEFKTEITVTYKFMGSYNLTEATEDFFEIARYFFAKQASPINVEDLKISVGELLVIKGALPINPVDWN